MLEESIMNNYQIATAQTAVYPEATHYTTRELNYLILGLAGEAGELTNKYKKLVRSGNVTLDLLRPLALTSKERADLLDELGDILWYMARLCTVLDTRLETVALSNNAKLTNRQDKGQLKEHI